MSSDASSFISLSTFTPLTQFAMTSTSIVLNVVSGILSTLSSLVILNIIRLSSQKLTTTYHRIMTFMSVFDIMASVSMALTTLPMPSDDMLRFAGPMLGNKTTCQTQGYFLLMGLTGGGALYVCLSWYFVCKVTLKMDSEKIRKIIEPIYYIYSICFALFLPSYNLFKNAIDTVPKSSFCIIGPTHSHCDNSIDENFLVCDEDTLQKLQGTLTIVKACVGFNVFMIVVAMVIIIRTILKKNRSIKRQSLLLESNDDASFVPSFEDDVTGTGNCNNDNDNDNDNNNNISSNNNNSNNNNTTTTTTNNNNNTTTSDLKYSRVLVIQALMYIFAYLVTWVFMIIPMALNLKENVDNVLLAFKAVFFPLQGFWNLIIFVYDKAYLVYQSEQEKGYWNAIKAVVFHPYRNTTGILLPPSLTCRNQNKEHDGGLVDEEDASTYEQQELNDGVHDFSFETFDGQLDANAIMRNMYHQQYQSSASSQGKQNPMKLIKLLHSMNSESSGERIYTPGTTYGPSTSHGFSDGNVYERGGKRMVRIYLNPPKKPDVPEDDPYRF